MASAGAAREAAFVRDRELYLEHDPFAGHEIELKLAVRADIDPLRFVRSRIEADLRDGTLHPYAADPFWAEQKGYVGSGEIALDTYVFGAAGGADGRLAEAFKIVVGMGKCRIRRKAPAGMPADRAAGQFVLDRTEEDEVLDDGDVGAMLAALDVGARRLGRPATYVGHYRRRLICIACVNTLTKHRYALMADQCRSERGERMLQQLELEYIWRRAPLGRPFSREEIYDDMAQLGRRLVDTYGGDEPVLSLSRETKFAWLAGAS
jgi:hypothetical protein